MSNPSHRYLVTGASGQLGRLVVEGLVRKVPAEQVAVIVRNPKAGESLAALGVEVRIADYAKPETLDAAFAGIDRALLSSSSEVGQRTVQHRNVIDAAKRAGVTFLAYTSLLHADTSPLGLAVEHRETEAALSSSGIPFAVLRNGWYTENKVMAIPAALEHGAYLGSAGEGRFSTASRADYAEAAVAVLLADDAGNGCIYELAGDRSFTLPEFVAEVARQSAKPVAYKDLPEAEYKSVLLGAGLPEHFAELLADSDAGAAKGALLDESGQLGALIGRRTTPYAATIAEALRG